MKRVWILLLIGCGGKPSVAPPTGDCVPPADAAEGLLPYCVQTERGAMQTEATYIAGVVSCEIAGVTQASAALEAQAIAARTYLYRYLLRRGDAAVVPIGPRFQCWRAPRSAREVEAATRTADLVLHYDGTPITGNYVSGAAKLRADCTAQSPRANGYREATWDRVRERYVEARDARRRRPFSGVSWTEVVVTRNEGRSGDDVVGTPMAGEGDQNRGAFGQYAAICLAGRGYDTAAILAYFYGADISISSDLGGPGGHAPLPELEIPGFDGDDADLLPAKPEGDEPLGEAG